jgi:serine/threonine-protein kinase
MPTATAAPTAVGPYVIEQELGRGAFGVVYRAHPADAPDHAVALKVVEGRGSLDRLMAEPVLLAKLRHPCIVSVEDYFVHAGQLAIALEFIPGEDLKALLDRGETFTPAQVRDLLIQVGGALAEAHAKGVIHRDLKPSNILVDRRGNQVRYVLTDFGIGQEAEGIQTQKRAGGTYFFMAPEQLRGRPGPQADLWALGVTAYQLLTGQLPFPGPTLTDLSRQIQYADPVPPGKLRPDVPADLEAALGGLLTKPLTERTPSATALLDQLGHRGDSQNVLSARPARPAPKDQDSLDRQIARKMRSNRRWLIFFVVLYLLPSGVLKGGILLAAIGLFYRTQTDRALTFGRRAGLVLAAWALLGLHYFLGLHPTWDLSLVTALGFQGQPQRPVQVTTGRQTPPSYDYPPVLVVAFVVGFLAMFVISLLGPAWGSARWAELRRLQREQALREAALAGATGSDAYLSILGQILESRYEDVELHLRYAEAWYARGDHRGAAAAARLLLDQDPYHFGGNLLLANAYHALGLYAEGLKVCEAYLAVAGYCFEFSELRQQCLARSKRP